MIYLSPRVNSSSIPSNRSIIILHIPLKRRNISLLFHLRRKISIKNLQSVYIEPDRFEMAIQMNGHCLSLNMIFSDKENRFVTIETDGYVTNVNLRFIETLCQLVGIWSLRGHRFTGKQDYHGAGRFTRGWFAARAWKYADYSIKYRSQPRWSLD